MLEPVRDEVSLKMPAEDALFRPPLFWWALIALIFAVGLYARLYDLSSPPLDFHPTRQLHSALIARGMFAEGNANFPAWQQQMAANQWHAEGLIEPQVFERLTAFTYRLTGADLRVPRLYAILFWMLAAGFLAALSVQLVGRGGALVAALFFLVWPYGVVASRAFQPEPLMILLMVAALWAAVRWQQRGGWGWAIAAGLLAGLSMYIKSVAVFFVGPALLVLALTRCGLRRALRDPQAWALALLAALPSVLYYLDGVVLHHYLVGQFSLRFFPQMWLDPAFYLRWISNLGRAVPFEMTLVAIIGIFLIRRPAYRVMLLAMWAGYFIYGMTLPHHISTHDYYHLPLYPWVALGLGGVAETVFNNLRGPRVLARGAAAAVLLAALVITGYDARTTIKRSNTAAQAQAWEQVGQSLGPGASVVALVDDYGAGLKYWGWINPALWPTANDILWQNSIGQTFDFSEYFNSQVAGKDYFVVGLLDELDRQPQLKEILYQRYTILRQGPNYLVFDLRSPKAKVEISRDFGP